MDLGAKILNNEQDLQKVRRIAFEIYERNFDEDEIIFAGIYEKGYTVAEILIDEFQKIAPITTRLVKISLDKKSPLQSTISLDCAIEELQKKTIILIDDVLNTGRTFAYSLKPFLNIEIKKLQTAVLVDRNHSTFPISADYVGYALSTTLQEHIHVELYNKDYLGVYIS